MTRKFEIAPGVYVALLVPEEDGVCEKCGKANELRPYGPRLESGRRMRVCFDCAMLDKPETDKAINEFFDGEESP